MAPSNSGEGENTTFSFKTGKKEGHEPKEKRCKPPQPADEVKNSSERQTIKFSDLSQSEI